MNSLERKRPRQAESAGRRLASISTAASVLAWSALSFAAPVPETGWGFPRDASPEDFGAKIDWLINITNFFLVVLFVIMVIWMGWACLKHNRTHKAEYDHGESRHSVKTAITVSAIIFFIVDGNLWVQSTIDVNGTFWNFARAEADPGTVRIEVNAHQWLWDARYAGADGKFNTKDDAVTSNDIRVPVNTPILIQLASTDVIHNFFLPNFRVKQDAVPGTITPFWFKAKDTGEFEIACAQHCGANHYKMKALLTVLPKEDYGRWVRQSSADSARIYDEGAEDQIKANWGWEWRKI